MIQKFIDTETKKLVVDFYNKISNNDFTIDYLLKSCVMMDKILFDAMPEAPEGTVYVTNSIWILSGDILEMDSISEEEKEESIREMVEMDKKELLDLTKQLIDKIESDFVEAKIKGYCAGLLQEFNN